MTLNPVRFDEAPGLLYYAPALDRCRQAELCHFIDSLPPSAWLPDYQRRRLCFGHLYDYAARGVVEHLGPLPEILAELAADLVAAGALSKMPDQAVVNEYLPGQGISRHVDARCFGDEIAAASLGSTAMMRFRRRGVPVLDLVLRPGSLLVMSGPARSELTHEIPARLKDVVDGAPTPRGRRLSITLRRVEP